MVETPAEERQRLHDAYMRLRGDSCEEACAVVDILLNPDPRPFLEALSDWAYDFETRNRKE